MRSPIRTLRYLPLARKTDPRLRHPECPGEGVTFVLYQKEIQTPFWTRLTRAVAAEARCARTDRRIPVMAWTDEMERAARVALSDPPRRASRFQFKPNALRVFAATAAVLLVTTAVIWARLPTARVPDAAARIATVAADPSPGDRLRTETPGTPGSGRWWVIQAVSTDSIAIRDIGPVARVGFLRDGVLSGDSATGRVVDARPAHD